VCSSDLTAEDIKKYLKENNNDNKIDVDYFIDYYESKDWMIGKNKMKDWQATVRNWIRRDNKESSTPNKSQIINEIMAKLSGGQHNSYTFKSPEAEKVWKKASETSVLWNLNEWQVNQAINNAI